MSLQQHNRAPQGGKAVVFFRIGKFQFMAAAEFLPAAFPATGPHPEHFREDGHQMPVKALVDFPDFLITLTRERAAQIHHYHIGAVMDHFTEEPG